MTHGFSEEQFARSVFGTKWWIVERWTCSQKEKKVSAHVKKSRFSEIFRCKKSFKTTCARWKLLETQRKHFHCFSQKCFVSVQEKVWGWKWDLQKKRSFNRFSENEQNVCGWCSKNWFVQFSWRKFLERKKFSRNPAKILLVDTNIVEFYESKRTKINKSRHFEKIRTFLRNTENFPKSLFQNWTSCFQRNFRIEKKALKEIAHIVFFRLRSN